jgi:hypothetical protein
MRVRQFTASAAGKALPAVVACLLIGAGTAGAAVLAADEPTEPVSEQPAVQPPADAPPVEAPPVEPPVVPPAPDADDSDDTDADDDSANEVAGAPVTAPPCPADVRNHGAYVSSVARDPAYAGPQHGAIVAAAAQSDCGKKPGEDTDAEDTDAEDADDTDAQDTDAQGSAKPTGQVKKAEKAQQRAAKAAAKGKPAKG